MKGGFRLAAVAALSLGLLGCAQQAPKTLYQWGGYQQQMYRYLEHQTQPEQQLGEMQADADKARANGAALPPGFQAHMGMLNLQLGREDQARTLLEAEKTAFPESAPYMDFLLKRMTRKPT